MVLETLETLWETKAQTSAEWALACATVWQEVRNGARADAALALAMDIAPDWAPPYEEEARVRSSRGHLAFAVEAAQRVIELRSNPEDTRYWSAFIGAEFFKAGEYDKALDYLQRGEPEEPEWTYWYQRAVCNERTGDFAQARDCFARAASMRVPEIPDALRIGALHYYQGALADAATALETVSTSSDDVEVERLALLSRALLRLERADEAVTCLRARVRERDSAELVKIAALAEELAGNPDEAVDEYRTAIENHGLALEHRLARALQAAGRTEEAVETWVAASEPHDVLNDLDTEPDPDFSASARGATARVHDKDWGAAVPALKRLAASASSADNVKRTYRQLGHALAAGGQLDEALHAFMRASDELTPHPSETARDYAPLGSFERYAAAYETLPIESNVVLYESFHGVRTGCNPLALCQHLLRERPDLHHVWAVKDDAAIHSDLLGHPKVSFVRLNSEGYRLHLATAAYLISNNTFPRYFVRRDRQVYLNTWHGIPWKTLGRDIAENPFYYDNIARNLLQATHLAFPDEHTARIMLEAHAIDSISTAQLIIAGQPRMDNTLTLDEDKKRDLRSRLGVVGNERTVLYAPTWRGSNESPDTSIAPYVDAISALAQIPGARLLLRVHYLISRKLELRKFPGNVTIVPEDIDTNELLAVSDVLVSDYSSLIFDYAALDRPIIKYVYDLDDYTSERGLYFSIDDVPGVSCTTESELHAEARQAIQSAKPAGWSTWPTAGTWKNEDGKATERVATALFADDSESVTKPERDPHRVLVTIGALYPNGITRSLRNLIASDPETTSDVQLLLAKGVLNNPLSHDAATELRKSLDITPTTYHRVFTRRENLAWARLRAANQKIEGGLREVLRRRFQRDRRRVFGDVKFSAAVDFSGYNLHQSALIGLGFPSETRTVYVIHNDFEQERLLKYPSLRSTGTILSNFDVLASVSESTRKINQENLEREFSVPPELHFTMPNTINLHSILLQGAETLDDDLAEWFAAPGPHVVIAARLSVEKNHAAVLDVLADFARTGAVVPRIAFFGDGPRKAELIRQAKDLGIADRIFFAGHRSNPYPAMKRADALLLPSLHEGQPMVLLEAMTLGTPVVCTNIPGPASLLEDGRFGLLVDPTPEGLTAAITAIVDDTLAAPEVFDPRAHQRAAVDAFRNAIGRSS